MCAADLRARRRTFLGAALAVPLVSRFPLVHASGAGPLADAPAGRFLGAHIDGVGRFLGIRYGQDTAATRFRPPVAARREADAVRAWTHGPVSPQRGKLPGTQGEDCLRLNLWTPSIDPRARRPVMVYIHGGAYHTGSGNEAWSEGAKLAARGDVVVVTLTHRLNAFGYLSLGRLDARFPDSGNAGQLDLVLALQWIRDNIAAFGGDPRQVTLFGQSGGGAKIATLMAMPAAQGLFHRAITMSGQQVTASGPLNATRRAQAYLAKLSRDPVAAPIEKLVEALDAVDPILGGGVYFGPVLDGRTLTRHPFYPDAHPLGRSIPMMLGNTVAETRAFFPSSHRVFQGLDWTNLAERLGPELRVDIAPEHVIERYREWFPNASPAEVFIRATTAGRSWRGQIIEAEERARAGVPAYVYQLDFDNAMHTDDIGLAFGTAPDMSSAKRALSDTMMDVFLRFAKTGDPGWPAYDLPARKTMVFDRESRVVEDPRGRERELFATVPYIQPGT
ncbi:MAG: carboxylesterase/lipase family protein [Betaproteobacteria bacterium]|nr:carboxylesterase/lipase family protein [Betaproteobacteria bacterium]